MKINKNFSTVISEGQQEDYAYTAIWQWRPTSQPSRVGLCLNDRIHTCSAINRLGQHVD